MRTLVVIAALTFLVNSGYAQESSLWDIDFIMRTLVVIAALTFLVNSGYAQESSLWDIDFIMKTLVVIAALTFLVNSGYAQAHRVVSSRCLVPGLGLAPGLSTGLVPGLGLAPGLSPGLDPGLSLDLALGHSPGHDQSRGRSHGPDPGLSTHQEFLCQSPYHGLSPCSQPPQVMTVQPLRTLSRSRGLGPDLLARPGHFPGPSQCQRTSGPALKIFRLQ
ncbi:uncharacterized protein LOC144101661 [Amblyomma americanum]